MDVTFTDQSSGTVSSWSWNFGDGNVSAEQSPTHTYTVPGNYTVSLTVSGPGGSDTETKTGYIVYGGAFDHQIDRLRERDLKVELISTVGKEAQP